MSEKVDTVIIGAGFSGLSAGIRLAQFQDSVLILESHSVTGGLNSYYFRGGKENVYSSGLHTVTNFRSDNRRWGAGMICRNLGIDPDALQLRPPKYPSRIITPVHDVLFDNDIELLQAEVSRDFPAESDRFAKFVQALPHIALNAQAYQTTSTEGLAAYFKDPTLIDLLELPVYIYGGYREGKIDFATFCVLFRSIFLDGCGSPEHVKLLLDLLVSRFKALGGTLKMRRTVQRILTRQGKFVALELSNGDVIEADYCMSSAGLSETCQLVDEGQAEDWGQASNISVFETLINMPRPLDQCGVRNTLLMVSNQQKFAWSLPDDRLSFNHLTLSALDNYAFTAPPHQHVLKIGCYQRGSLWQDLEDGAYLAAKTAMEAVLLKELEQLFPGLDVNQSQFTESLTPKTVIRYTSHLNGCIYGGQRKSFDGTTPIKNLFVVGNDQGGIGIMGTLTSGIVVSNFQVILQR